jgi:hypothetical protein
VCSGNVAFTLNGGCVVADSVQLRLENMSVINNTAQFGYGGAAFLVNTVQVREGHMHTLGEGLGAIAALIVLI